MGTWGQGPFENDLAADWVYELEDTGSAAVSRALSATRDEDSLDADTGAIALAAAEVVAASLGEPREDVPAGVRTWVADNASAIPRSAGDEALDAIRRIESSELAELWRESGDHQQWLDHVADLERRLRVAVGQGSAEDSS